MKKLPIVLFSFGSIIAAIFVWIAVCHGGEKQDITVDAVIAQTNGKRAERHIPVLQPNSVLNRIAQKRLEDMLEKRYFAHISPSGQDVSGLADSEDYWYRCIGENIAKGNFKSSVDLVEFWMKSPRHRKNILDREYREIGVAVGVERVEGRSFWHAVQVFGTSRPH